jgi:hypothetical protein
MDLLNPKVGYIIDYTHRGVAGWIEVIKVDSHYLEFLDNYKDTRNHFIKFRWSTWKIHLESTLDNVRLRSLSNYSWEV